MGIELKVCYFKPETTLNEDTVRRYESNILGCTRQFRYSPNNNNSIDMVLSINGIPVVALELKNQLTGQNYVNGINQYKTDRDPKEFCFRMDHRFLVYFAVDLKEVWMTTQLNGKETRFVPFNQGSNGPGVSGGKGNPVNKDGYDTFYLWEEVLQRDSLVDIIHRFVSHVKEKEEVVSKNLWLRYPDKYFIYKISEVKKVAVELGSDYRFKNGAYSENIRNFIKLYNEISLALKADTDMVNLLQSQLSDTCYPDPELKTLTIDVGFYISRYYSQNKSDQLTSGDWYPSDYAPGLTVEEWVKLLGDPDVFTTGSLEIMKRMKDYGGQASCTQLAVKYGETKNFYNAGSSSLAKRIADKKNIILQGAPGVGKTFAARRLAWSMMGEKDDNRIEFVQFHQNYSYEDFMMGYKPVDDGFELRYGIFYRFCQKAANQPDKDFFFIIDEINRGNMSKIFGELLMLIEKDYRGTKVTLAYNGLPFSVPKNLYIIGMMNTADRSLAMIDYALRRRFSFFEVEPGFDSQGFIDYQKGLKNEILDELIDKVKELNKVITLDKSLGKGFCIGHSYFCGHDVCTEEWLRSIVDYDILPMLREYWFDEPNTIQHWENTFHGVFQ